jgi:hypothetical protein
MRQWHISSNHHVNSRQILDPNVCHVLMILTAQAGRHISEKPRLNNLIAQHVIFIIASEEQLH